MEVFPPADHQVNAEGKPSNHLSSQETSGGSDFSGITTRTFVHQSVFQVPVDRLAAFHARPEAIRLLTPPPLALEILRDDRTSLTAGEFEFQLRLGPLGIDWLAVHEPGPGPLDFVDRMKTGPMAYWRHEHIIQPDPLGARLTDRVTLAHKPGSKGWLTRLVFDGLPLRILFMYRHWRTRLAITKAEG